MAGKLQTQKADSLRETAEGQERPLRIAIKSAVKTVKDSVVISQLTRAINEGDEEAALEATKVEQLKEELSGPLTAGVVLALLAGSELGRLELPATLQAEASSLDILNSDIQRWIRTNGARQIRQISGGSRKAIKKIISAMMADDINARQAARMIRDFIGLTVPQQATLQRLRAAMIENGATKAVIERTLAARSTKMLNERAFTIARNEAFTAVAQGRQMYWEQLVDRGVLDEDTLRKWITAEDERVCPVCEPMHNQVRGLTEPFAKGTGGTTLTTPAHVICRCSVILLNPRMPE